MRPTHVHVRLRPWNGSYFTRRRFPIFLYHANLDWFLHLRRRLLCCWHGGQSVRMVEEPHPFVMVETDDSVGCSSTGGADWLSFEWSPWVLGNRTTVLAPFGYLLHRNVDIHPVFLSKGGRPAPHSEWQVSIASCLHGLPPSSFGVHSHSLSLCDRLQCNLW